MYTGIANIYTFHLKKQKFLVILTVIIDFVTFSIQRFDGSLEETMRNVMSAVETIGTAVNSAIGINAHMPRRRKITPYIIIFRPVDA